MTNNKLSQLTKNMDVSDSTVSKFFNHGGLPRARAKANVVSVFCKCCVFVVFVLLAAAWVVMVGVSVGNIGGCDGLDWSGADAGVVGGAVVGDNDTLDARMSDMKECARADGYDVDNMTLLKYKGMWGLWRDIDLLELFLYNDTTSNMTYVLGEYDCKHFSLALARNLSVGGYDAGVLSINSKYRGIGGHWMVWCVVGGDTVYIEAITDGIGLHENYMTDDYVVREISIRQAERDLSFFERCCR